MPRSIFCIASGLLTVVDYANAVMLNYSRGNFMSGGNRQTLLPCEICVNQKRTETSLRDRWSLRICGQEQLIKVKIFTEK